MTKTQLKNLKEGNEVKINNKAYVVTYKGQAVTFLRTKRGTKSNYTIGINQPTDKIFFCDKSSQETIFI